MNKNIRRVFFLTTLLVLLVGLGALSAADVSDNTTATQSIAQDTQATSTQVASIVSDTTNNKVAEDTQIATTSKAKSVAKDNTQTSTKTKKAIKSSNTIDINDSNFNDYFTDSGLNGVDDGDTINLVDDITRNNETFTVNKAINLNGNNHTISLNTTSGSYFGNETGGRFTLDNGASFSNITGVNFYNTQVNVTNAHNITFNNLNVTVENQRIGSGVGVFSIRDNSSFVTVQNSNFYTTNNGGSSNLVLAWANNCTLKNNTVTGAGDVGNLIYITTYNVNGQAYTNTTLNRGNRIIGNTVYGPSNSSGICMGITISGGDNFVEDNTVYYSGMGISTQWMSTSSINWSIGDYYDRYVGNTYKNNVLNNGSSFSASLNSTIINNTCSGSVTSGENSTLENNNFTGSVNLRLGSNATNNILGSTTLYGNNILEDNKIYGDVTVRGSNILINRNKITGDIIIYSRTISNITITNNIVCGILDNDIGNPNIYENNNTYNASITNINSVKSKSLKSERQEIEITARNINNYFRLDESTNPRTYWAVIRKFPTNSDIIISLTKSYYLVNVQVPVNSTLVVEEAQLTYGGINVRENGTFANSTCEIKADPDFAVCGFTGNNGVVDNVNIRATDTLMTREYAIIDASGDNFTVKNSNIYIEEPMNTIDWTKTQRPTVVPIQISGKGVTFENNNIVINITSYEGTYPTCFAFYITGDGATIRNNNITIISQDNMPGWLYAFEITSSNNLITNNNISVKGVNYTAGVYFDSSVYENNTVSNNVINVTCGNSGFGEGTTNENVGYIITFTNRAYGGGSYLPGTGSVKNNTAVNNTLIGNGYAIYGVEQFGGDNTTIVNNTIILNGTAVSGVAMIGINSTVTGNNITVNGKDNRTYATVDYLTEQTTGISLQRGTNNTVTDNIIDSQNNAGIIISGDQNTNITGNTVTSLNNTYAVAVFGANNINVSDNNLKAKEFTGNAAVLNNGTNTTIDNKITTILTVEPITTVSSGSQITVIGKLVDGNGNVLPSRQIHMVVENVTQMQITNNNGTFTKTIKVNNVGTYNITLTYEGNDEYKASDVTTTYTVTKANTTVTIDPIDGVLGKEVSFTAHVTDENSQPVTGGYVIFKVNGVTLKDENNTPIQVNVTNGVATLNTTATWSKAVNTTAAYSGSDNYNKARTDNGSISIAKQNATVTVTINENIKPGENLIATVNVTDSESNPVNAGTVIFKINGKTLKDENNQTLVYNVTNGTVTLNYTIPENYSAKTYTLTAVYGGSIYSRAETTQNFTLNKLDANVALNVTTDDLKPGSQIIAIATITDANGNPVTRGHVTFKLNNKTITDNDTRYVVDVTNGVAVLNYTIPSNYSAKAYRLSAVFGGSNYNTNEAAQNITLSKIDTNIVTQNITITDNTLNVQATINNVETGNIANERTQKVSIKYDKHTVINSTVIENGVIDLNTTLTDVHAGEHIIEIVTSGNSIYNPNRVNATVTTQ